MTLVVLWFAFWVYPTIMALRCSAMLLSYPPQCVSAMDMWVGDLGSWGSHWSGYLGATMFLAFAVPGVVVGVMLLLSKPVESRASRVWRGLSLALALVLVPLSLLTLGGPWPRAVDVLGGVGIIYVILALLWTWPDPLERPNGSVAASLDTSTFPPSRVPSDSWRGWLRFVVFLVAGAGLVLAGLVGAVAGLVVFIDWIADLVGLPTAFYCGPSACKAASATAGVLGLLAASVAVVGVGAGMRLLRKTHMVEGYAAWRRGSTPRGKP